MVNLCICSMQVHQSRFSLFFPISSSVVVSSCLQVYVPPFVSQAAPPRCRSWPHCCSWPPSSGLGRGTYTYRRPGTGTCTQWPRRAGCCKDRTEMRLVTQDPPETPDKENMGWEGEERRKCAKLEKEGQKFTRAKKKKQGY